eukprot:176615-Rhodomonas_salina.1
MYWARSVRDICAEETELGVVVAVTLQRLDHMDGAVLFEEHSGRRAHDADDQRRKPRAETPVVQDETVPVLAVLDAEARRRHPRHLLLLEELVDLVDVAQERSHVRPLRAQQ